MSGCLNNFKCPTCEEKVYIDEIIETLQIDEMVLMLNKKLSDKELYTKNIDRLKECLEFEKNRLNIKLDPGSKVDVLDINSMKWHKGEILKRTNIAQVEKSGFSIDAHKNSALVFVEYKVDGSKNNGYYRADSMLLAPEGYFTSEESPSSRLNDPFMETTFLSNNDSSDNIIRTISHINRLLRMRTLNTQTNF